MTIVLIGKALVLKGWSPKIEDTQVPLYGCKSKCEVRINPQNPHAIQTCDPDRSRPHDPDRSRPHDPDLWSRPLCFMLVGHFLFQSTEKYYTLYYKVLLQYYFVLQSISLYYKVRCWVISWILEKFWPSRSRPRSRPFQTRSRPVSMESKGSVHSQPYCPRRKNRSVHPAQNDLIQFKSYMKWLSWFQALRSRRAEKTFYESGRSRRPDHRGTIQTRLSTHAHIYIYIHT